MPDPCNAEAPARGLDLGPAADGLIAELGAQVVHATLVTTLGTAVTRRRSYRLDLADGRTVKIRRSSSVDKARRYADLVRDLSEPGLARIRAHRDDLTLEEWVPGAVLASVAVSDEHLAAAATLLARLNATRHVGPQTVPDVVPTTPVLERIGADLRELVEAGALDHALGTRLHATAASDAPRDAAAGVLHTDLCPENLVVDPGGMLRAIDNEGLRIGPRGFDLARAWYRWPMAPSRWGRFIAAYSRVLDPEPALGQFRFWRIAAVARSARLRVVQRDRTAHVPLGSLRSLAAELAGERVDRLAR